MISKDSQEVKYNVKIQINDFVILQKVGMSTFGRVCLCRHKKTKKIYAMKMLKKFEIIRMKQIDHIYNEYNILSVLNHPFIVELKGVNVTDPKYLYFILEYIPGGELFTLLRSKNIFPPPQTRFYTAHIVTVFEYLHSKDIIYRDLKPENILINSNGYLKLTDFGFAKVVKDGKTYTLCGTPEYLAPEIILNKGHGKAVDWWTLGVLMYEMLVGIDPFNDDDPMLIYQNIIKGKVLFPNTIDKDAKNLIKHFLVADTTKRFGCLKNGVGDIIDHKFFAGFNWKDLVFMKMEPPYVPTIKNELDTSNFSNYADSNHEVQSIKPDNDPFFDW